MLGELLALVVLVACTSASLLICFQKWGWLEAWEVYRPWFLFKRCDYCAGYWISVLLLAIALGLLLGGWWPAAAFLLGLPAAAVTRALTHFSSI